MVPEFLPKASPTTPAMASAASPWKVTGRSHCHSRSPRSCDFPHCTRRSLRGPHLALKAASQAMSSCVKKNADMVHMGVSENSVPLNPMVNDHYPY